MTALPLIVFPPTSLKIYLDIYITDVKEVRTLNAAASGGKKFRGFILKKFISGLFDVAKRLRSSLRLICTTATPSFEGIEITLQLVSNLV